MPRAVYLTLFALTVLVAACGDDDPEASRVEGDTLTVYASLPAHGASAQAGNDAEIGMRTALADVDGGVGGREVRFVRLSSTRPGEDTWDPGTIEANAERAAEDPTTIAYLGELDQGGSAVSLPVTNRELILQVSPADGLTSLGRRLPGEARDGSERYYPNGAITFARLVAPDLDAAREIAAALVRLDVGRLVVLHGAGIAGRELEAMVVAELGGEEGRSPEITRVAVRDDDPEHVADVVEQTAAARPDAILYTGPAGREARAVLATLADLVGDVPVIGGPALAASRGLPRAPEDICAWTGVPDISALPAQGRELLDRMRAESGQPLGTEAVLGYAAMDVALDAVERVGTNRRKVALAARESVDNDEVVIGHGLGDRAHNEALGQQADSADVSTSCVDLGTR